MTSPAATAIFRISTRPEGQRVLRLYRLYMSSLLSELEDAAARPEVLINAFNENGGLMLELKDPKVSYRRSCLVPKELSQPLFSRKIQAIGFVPTGSINPPKPITESPDFQLRRGLGLSRPSRGLITPLYLPLTAWRPPYQPPRRLACSLFLRCSCTAARD